MINRLPRRALPPVLFAIAIAMLLLSTPTTASTPSRACVNYCVSRLLECNSLTGDALVRLGLSQVPRPLRLKPSKV